MTHFKPMDESEGDFTSESVTEYFCGKCKKKTPHTVLTWESKDGGYVDYKYTCQTCGKVCWIDGIDS
jgi:hypothetical protein